MWLYFLILFKVMQAIVLYRCYKTVGFSFFTVAFPNFWCCPSLKPGYMERAISKTTVYTSIGLPWSSFSKVTFFFSCSCLLVVIAKGPQDSYFISESQSSNCAWTQELLCLHVPSLRPPSLVPFHGSGISFFYIWALYIHESHSSVLEKMDKYCVSQGK